MSKKEQTKQQIHAAAWQLFLEVGYNNTSTRDIAKAANVANGTVFTHFPTKISILKYSFEKELDTILKTAAIADKSKHTITRMMHYAHYLYAFYLSNREFSRELLKEIMWQHSELTPQLMAFKHLLIHDTGEHQHLADAVMDIYFMTLLDGLNNPDSSLASMLEKLETKLSLLCPNGFSER